MFWGWWWPFLKLVLRQMRSFNMKTVTPPSHLTGIRKPMKTMQLGWGWGVRDELQGSS